jgi:predicted Zn-dependent protease
MILGRKKSLFSVVLVLVMVTFFAAGQVYAYVTTSPYTLSGGILGRTYYIGDPNGNWTTAIRNGVSAWNSSPTEAYFTEGSTSTQTVNYFVGEWGNVSWCGYTYYVDSGGSYINYGGYPNQNWSKSEIKIDDPVATGCPAFTKKATAAHELGHAMGLKHSNVSGVLMSSPTGAETPQQDDVDGINSLY